MSKHTLAESYGVPKDFRNFIYLIWQHLGLPEPTPVQYDIANFLQHGPSRAVVEAFRGVGKSWITASYVVWKLAWKPDYKFLVVSASKQRADNFTQFVLHLIYDVPWLSYLTPGPKQRCSMVSFDVGPAGVDQQPSVVSLGITGQLAGNRADEIVPDDVEVPKNSATQQQRDKLADAVREFDAILKPGGRVKYLGTPQTEQSLYNVLASRGYTLRIWPARYPQRAKIDYYEGRLAPMIQNTLEEQPELEGYPTDPKRFPEDDLADREKSWGKTGFALQFMLDTRLSDAERYPLRLNDLICMDLDVDVGPEKVVWTQDQNKSLGNEVPNVGLTGDGFHRPMAIEGNFVPYRGAVMSIDPSGRGKDETGYAVTKMLNSQIFCLDAGGTPGGYDRSSLERLAKIAKQYKVNKIIVEGNFGDGMWIELFKPVLREVYNVTVEELKASNQMHKEARVIDIMEPVMNQHRLVMDIDVIKRDYESVAHLNDEQAMRYMLFAQMTRITREKGALPHDDRLDALAWGVHYWVEAMAQSQDEEIEHRKQEAMDREIEEFMEDADLDLESVSLGGKGQSSNTDSILRKS